jgi:hypothetical protein
MQIIQSESMARRVQGLDQEQKALLDIHVRHLQKQSKSTDRHQGRLSAVQVYGFDNGATRYTLAYRYQAQKLELIMLQISTIITV